ncbi:MAG: asparagine synthase-related protein [Chitinispirillaceae bacterium]
MSDFLFSSIPEPEGGLSECLRHIHSGREIKIREFRGRWGTLAVSGGMYSGFDPLETDSHLFVIIGGPVFYFRDNAFLSERDSSSATESLYERWLEGNLRFDEDISGPFAILVVDKGEKVVFCITDLMMFIPVYCFSEFGKLMLGTHSDALAKAAGQENRTDPVSIGDFVLNQVVTYPYTFYRNIRQCRPSTIHAFDLPNRKKSESYYWLPLEKNSFAGIRQAADHLRNRLREYVSSVTEHAGSIAQFISAGEDSRALAGLMPENSRCDCFVFLDRMNREGRIAGKAARIYGLDFHALYRNRMYYLDILPSAARLIGSGQQYTHAHSIGFAQKAALDKYSAVFGGYLSDSLLKGYHGRKRKIRNRKHLLKPQESFTEHSVLKPDIIREIRKRQYAHMRRVKKLRPSSALEWFVLWPATMRAGMSNFHSSRRLFKSYEPFMCGAAVKVGAAVPARWKLNHRLFYKAMKPMLARSKWLPSSDGRLPYFPWWINIFLRFLVRQWRDAKRKTGIESGHQGPWCEWNDTDLNKKLCESVFVYRTEFEHISHIFTDEKLDELLAPGRLSPHRKVNLLQILHRLNDSGIEPDAENISRGTFLQT